MKFLIYLLRSRALAFCIAALVVGQGLGVSDAWSDGRVADAATGDSSLLTDVDGLTPTADDRDLAVSVPQGSLNGMDGAWRESQFLLAISRPVFIVLGLLAVGLLCVAIGWGSLVWHEYQIGRRLGGGPVPITPRGRE